MKLTACVSVPLQTTWSVGSTTFGIGLTTKFILWVVPVQVTLFSVTLGVTVIVPLKGVFPELVVTKDVIFPLPLLPKPMAAFVLVHE